MSSQARPCYAYRLVTGRVSHGVAMRAIVIYARM